MALLTFEYPDDVGRRHFRKKDTLAATESLKLDDTDLDTEIALTVPAGKVVAYEITIAYRAVDAP